MEYSVTKYGKPLDKQLYYFDEETKVFKSNEMYLVLDFGINEHITFYTNSGCNFKTGSHCTFNTNERCVFTTGVYCTFNTRHSCTFTTSSNCTFNTTDYCTFLTSHNCKFNTGYRCTFDIGSSCFLHTGHGCTIIYPYGINITLTRNLVLVDSKSSEVCAVNDYFKIELEGFRLYEDELDRLKEFPLDEPRLLMLYKYDELGKRLFEHYVEKGLL